ncbi:hypothetical protein PZA11_001674 [Diplocarpon coronariae]|uniref:Autophagy-related protein 33 n=1 Tax=Diplocarpon coronariae TaxID=2795749 RepID=A0A218Z003_9HELO|nr:hypothetical protein JHW43_000296 [Diplocarpon mali]OWP01258.1 hypothetical protein B2J93_5538 [Marssonina coronariae]
MAFKTVSTLKFVGSISLGLLTGYSYSLTTLTIPTLSTLPSATSASKAFTNLTYVSLNNLRALAAASSTSFLFAYILSPRSQKHPYLLWTSLLVVSSGFTEYALRGYTPKPAAGPKSIKPKSQKSQVRQMDSSYEVLGASDRESEGNASGEEPDEDVNGEEVRQELEGFMLTQIARTVIAGVGFSMSIVGLWGDGAADLLFIKT